jgi:hypothetical protein
MTLLERIEARRKAESCGRDDDPSQNDQPRKAVAFVPAWRKRDLARDFTRRIAA